jgi:hypothetical protein
VSPCRFQVKGQPCMVACLCWLWPYMVDDRGSSREEGSVTLTFTRSHSEEAAPQGDSLRGKSHPTSDAYHYFHFIVQSKSHDNN